MTNKTEEYTKHAANCVYLASRAPWTGDKGRMRSFVSSSASNLAIVARFAGSASVASSLR
jgi:hypothetical protein